MRLIYTRMASTKINELIQKLDKYNEKVKELKMELKEVLEDTEIYKAVYQATISTTDKIEVTEKDAAAHAYKIALKNYKKVANE